MEDIFVALKLGQKDVLVSGYYNYTKRYAQESHVILSSNQGKPKSCQ